MIRDAYLATRARTAALAAPLSPEDCALQSEPFTSPTKWHLAHTTWFFETFVVSFADADAPPFDRAYARLFNSYYNAVGAQHPRKERGLLSRPSLDDVMAYRRHVDLRVLEIADRPDLEARITLGLHHEEQHQELILTDVLHLFSRNPTAPVYAPDGPRPQKVPAGASDGWLAVPGGVHEIGHRGGGFCFDNELPRHKVAIEPFALAVLPVTCGGYLAFIEDGGYRRPELWLSDGWDAVRALAWKAPLHWRSREPQGRHGAGFHELTLAGEQPLDVDRPVCHVSYYEADAFARWAGARLPTEAEWEVAVESAAPLLVGEVWEWTGSAYGPYPGFRPAEGALGEYNGKFMCSQMVLRGGSCVTPPGHARATYRNFFPPDARWQFSGLRLARDA